MRWLFVFAALAGAGGTLIASRWPGPELIRTVSWFQLHPRVMLAKDAVCRDNPGGAKFDPECANARQAKFRSDIDAVLAADPDR